MPLTDVRIFSLLKENIYSTKNNTNLPKTDPHKMLSNSFDLFGIMFELQLPLHQQVELTKIIIYLLLFFAIGSLAALKGCKCKLHEDFFLCAGHVYIQPDTSLMLQHWQQFDKNNVTF